MNPKTLKALHASIRHWERMRDGKEPWTHATAGYCALCRIYAFKTKNWCNGCPVNEQTGVGCAETPYQSAQLAYMESDRPSFHAAAVREVKFLRSLLPKKRKAKK